MPRFGKKGFRGYSRAGVKAKPRKAAPRRRLQPAASAALAAGGLALGKRVYNRYKARQRTVAGAAKKSFDDRVSQTDGIVTAKAVVIGKQRAISFQEKVARTIRPPLIFKRNYAFSAECVSGRKAMFSFDINSFVASDLNTDVTTYKLTHTTDTTTTEATIAANSDGDSARFYVDYLKEQLRMVNSSSNSITGKIHLFAHKRDTDGSYGASSILINPINMLMYYSTQAPPPQPADVGGGQTVGNGWVFSVGGGNTGTNSQITMNMPGSSINPNGATGQMDPTLDFTSPHVKDGINFWFRKVSTAPFSLKPGQQFNSSFIFNDLPVMDREEQRAFIHVAGISYCCVVEFTGGIVGDSTAVTGNNVISSGDCQLSVIREQQRILGMKNTLRSKVLLQTAPLATIAIANQVIINADTGVGLSGTVIDA